MKAVSLKGQNWEQSPQRQLIIGEEGIQIEWSES